MPGSVYHPRVAAKVIVPAVGLPIDRVAQQQNTQTYTLNVRPTRVRFVANNYNEADECEITGTYDEMGLDPRYLRSAELYVYIGDADVSGDWEPTADQLRFVGIARDVSREFDENGGKMVHIKAQDYTCLFLEAKSYPATKYPPFSATLQQAWEIICDNTGYWDLDTHAVSSTVAVFRDKLVFEGGVTAPGPTLGSAMPPRIAALGKLQVHGTPDAWGIWRTCCESLGFISYIRGDRCVVTTATDFYTSTYVPRLIYGENVKSLRESRDLGTLSAKWVCVRSYDPLANRTIEAFWPDPSIAPRKKKLAASAMKAGTSIKAQDYECFDLPFAVADQQTAINIARRIWEERTRQEIHGTLHTTEMSVPTVTSTGSGLAGASGTSISNGAVAAGSLAAGNDPSRFDLLKLAAGDQIQIEIAREALDNIQSLTTIAARISALRARGYSADMANFIASNLDSITKLPPQFMVHSVETEMQVNHAGGGSRYSVQIEYLNRIDISQSGETGAVNADADGAPQPPMAFQTMAAARQSVQGP